MRRLVPIVLLGMSCASPPSLEDRVLAVAREYVAYGRVDDENRWAPTLCKLSPSQARVSAEGVAHGRKIYYLFAKDRAAYIEEFRKPQPEGQVVVKEAWTPRPAPKDGTPRSSDEGGSYLSDVRLGDAWYTKAEKAGLFIMMKNGGAWTYATVTADGRRVTRAGALESCLSCHREAKSDSLFGIGHYLQRD